MSSISESSAALFNAFPQEDRVSSVIRAGDGVSEIYLLDRAYSEVARGVGELRLDLAPGPYKLRQRIGDAEQISSFDVVQSEKGFLFVADPLQYASPMPIQGTSTVEPSVAASPAEGPGLRVVVRAPTRPVDTEGSHASALAHLAAELGKLSVETLKGEHIATFVADPGIGQDRFQFTVDIALDPGYYVVVQHREDGRQECMPVFVHVNWWPQLYLLSLTDEQSRAAIAIELQNASISYRHAGAAGEPDELGLARLEAARKALSRGRSIGGWTSFADTGQSQPLFNDPLLALMDAHLLVSAWSAERDGQVQSLIDYVAEQFGNDFPDVLALRLALSSARSRADANSPPEMESETADILLPGPPLLSKSWAHLLRVFRNGVAISRVMPFQFVVGPSRGWFIWSEQRGARSEAAWTARGEAVVAGASRHRYSELAQEILIRLVESDKTEAWVDKIQAALSGQAAAHSKLFADPLVHKLATSLSLLTDPVLRGIVNSKALQQSSGAPAQNSKPSDSDVAELVRRALRSQGLPDDRLELALRQFVAALKDSKLLFELLAILGTVLAIKLGFLLVTSRDKD